MFIFKSPIFLSLYHILFIYKTNDSRADNSEEIEVICYSSKRKKKNILK